MRIIHLLVLVTYSVALIISSLEIPDIAALFILKALYLVLVVLMKKNSTMYLLDFFLVIWSVLIETPALIIYSMDNRPDFVVGIFAFAFPNLIASIFATFREIYILKNTSNLKISNTNSQDKLIVIAIGVLSSVIAIIYLTSLKEIPILSVLKSGGSNVDLLSLRDSSLKTLDVPTYMRYLIAWARDFLFPIAASASILLMLREEKVSKVFVVGIFLLGLLHISASTEKAPISFYIFAIFMSVMIFYRINKIRLNRNLIIALFVPIFVIPIFLFALSAQSGGVESAKSYDSAINNFFYRAFLVPARVALIHFEVYPNRENFLEGSSMNIINELAGKEFFNISNYLYIFYNPFTDYPDANGYANASFISEIWANFGWIGVFIVSILCAVVIFVADITYIFGKKNILTISAFSAMFIGVFSLISGNFTIFLVTKGFIIQIVLLYTLGKMQVIDFSYIKKSRIQKI
jgi:oligosaccharide repeat unit polymerase